MGSSGTKQLERIEQLLTPRQATLLEVREATNFATPQDYFVWLAERPGCPMQLLLGERIGRRMSGRPKPLVERAIYESRSEIAFLWDLFLHVNDWVSTMCTYVLQDLMWAGITSVPGENIPEVIQLAVRGTPEYENRRPNIPVMMTVILRELYATRRAVAKVERKHFGGQPILMKSYARDLANLIDTHEQWAHSFNDLIQKVKQRYGKHGRGIKDGSGHGWVNLEKLETSSETLAAGVVSDWVKCATCYARIVAGDVRGGLNVMVDWVRSARAETAKETGTGQSGQ